MAQWDVYDNPSPRARADFPFLVDVQSNLLAGLPTRYVVPLAPDAVGASGGERGLPRRMCPTFQIKGIHLVAVPHEAGPVESGVLRRPVVSLRDQAHRLIDALDAVISGV